MLSNYFKVAIAILLRRKFLTFVNLFGAALTLTVLVVAFAIFESSISPAGAQHRQGHMLSITSLRLTNTQFNRNWVAAVGEAFYRRYIATMQTPDEISYATLPDGAISYVDGRKLTSNLRRTDAAYWDILDFDVIDGRVLSADDVDAGHQVAVINEATADRFFPEGDPIGKRIVLGPESFEVVGVVADEPETSNLAFSDIWVPITTAQGRHDDWVGNGQAILYFDDPSRRGLAKEEYQQVLATFEPVTQPADLDQATSEALTALEVLAARTFGRTFAFNGSSSGLVARFAAGALLVALLFMALPAINMVNLNVGRILERAPEIGLRKALGASRHTLIWQFIFENIVLCMLGGLLAFAIAPIVLAVLNDTIFTYGRLSLRPSVLAAGFAFVLIFGVLSGAYPAWKMARLEPASALRGIPNA